MPDQDEDLFEFAVSCGEGTLIDYGVTSLDGAWRCPEDIDKRDPRFTIISAPATSDCATGK